MSKKKEKKHIISNIIIVILIIVMVISGYQVFDYLWKQHQENKPAQDLEQQITEQSEKDISQNNGFTLSRQAWEDLKSQNKEVIGYMAFPDGYVKEPIVQPPKSDPNKYLRHWIDGSYLSSGTPFLDVNNQLSDQNLTIYGHSHDLDLKTKFSPLTLLVNQNDWEKHHVFTIWYEDRIATYEIVAVQEYDTEAEHGDFIFNQQNFTSKQDMDEYMNYVRRHNLINSGGDDANYDQNTRYVTLQTCKRFYPRYHILLTCKQISERSWESQQATNNTKQ